MKFLKFYNMGVIIVILVFIGHSVYAEVTLPEETLFEEFKKGHIEQVRQDFDDLVKSRIESFDQAGDYNVINPVLDMRDATLKVMTSFEIIRAFNLWMAAEVKLRLSGGDIHNPNLNNRIALIAADLANKLVELKTIEQYLKEQSDVPDWLQNDANIADERMAQSILLAIAFLRGANMDDERFRLLNVAGEYLDTPKTLKDIDQQQGDLYKLFRLSD